MNYLIASLKHTNKCHEHITFWGRCTSADALWVLAEFDLLDAKEDNHVPGGKVRNWWRPVADHLSGYECPCTDEEPAVRENKGDYVWRGVTNLPPQPSPPCAPRSRPPWCTSRKRTARPRRSSHPPTWLKPCLAHGAAARWCSPWLHPQAYPKAAVLPLAA